MIKHSSKVIGGFDRLPEGGGWDHRYRVGLEDASHFSREYKRQFGQPPMRDVERLRATNRASSEPASP